MTGRTIDFKEARLAGRSSRERRSGPPGAVTFLALWAWCGLFSGLLEVGSTVVRKRFVDVNQFYWTSRHFVWLVPLINLLIFLALGVAVWLLALCSPRRARWISTRFLCALTLLPLFWAAFPRIYGLAGFVLVLGVAVQLAPVLERRAAGLRRVVRVSFPLLACLVAALAASLWGADRLKAWREEARPLPPPGSPNVLLIVLDTVAADHLSLYGYPRPTSPTIDELAARGVRFDRAQATSSWTLPSHSSMFTGRWPHELSAGWFTPLDGTYLTLAEALGSRGYATAGVVANAWYCAAETGLARGFTHYRDYSFPRLTVFKTAVLVDGSLQALQAVERFLEDGLGIDLLRPAADRLWTLLKINRKEASAVNREFLDWLSQRREPERPFFAFLNYYDAHYPFQLRENGLHRFGVMPRTNREADILRDWLSLINRGPSPSEIDFARDSYDDCVADLDEQLGRLIDELDRRSVLRRTWVIVTADHGESFGEHPGVFWHGTSLYEPQLHVPLLIVPPEGGPAPRVVTETASLRDLAATVADVVGLGSGARFPGESLARFWNGSAAAGGQAAAPGRALSEVVPLGSFGPNPSLWDTRPRWPLAALSEGDWTYIRHEENAREELYHVRDDVRQQHNLAADPSARSTLERLRNALDRLTAGPLTPQRFKP
jgi:arylsulfatase A-like enzyme